MLTASRKKVPFPIPRSRPTGKSGMAIFTALHISFPHVWTRSSLHIKSYHSRDYLDHLTPNQYHLSSLHQVISKVYIIQISVRHPLGQAIQKITSASQYKPMRTRSNMCFFAALAALRCQSVGWVWTAVASRLASLLFAASVGTSENLNNKLLWCLWASC